MTPEERELLKRSVELAEENNDILRSMRRSMRFARIMSIMYWVVIVGSAVGAYYLIQPYVESIAGVYGGAKESLDGVSSGVDSIKDLLNSL